VALLVSERKKQGLTQRQLAARLGKPPNFVARIETGQRNLSVVEFVVFARAFGADPAEMFNRLLAELPQEISA